MNLIFVLALIHSSSSTKAIKRESVKVKQKTAANRKDDDKDDGINK